MRLFFHIFALLGLLTLVLAWDKEDYEIFDLVSAIENAEGKGTTFYSWLGVSEKASNAEITKAYRKRSLELHPDKNHGVKGANERYARLGVVAQILRGEGRERYDFWMKRGVPKWRGTGYYYNRFRPGLGTVLVFLTLLTSVLQNVVHRMTYKSELRRVQFFMSQARKAAWGTNYEPKYQEVLNMPDGKEKDKEWKRYGAPRKVKVNIRGNMDVDGEEQEVLPGRAVEMLVQGEEVYLLGDGERHIINEDTPSKPSYKRTWPFALCFYVISLFGSRASSETEEAETPAQSEPQTAEKGNGKARASSSSSSSSDGEGEEEEVKSAGGARGVKKATAVAVGKTAGGRRRKGGKR